MWRWPFVRSMTDESLIAAPQDSVVCMNDLYIVSVQNACC